MLIRTTCWIVAVGLLLGVTACSGFLESDEPPSTIYWLRPLDARPAATGTKLASLSIAVTAAPGLDTDRLLMLGPGARLNYFAAARWPDHVPEVIESLLRRSFESTGRYSRVVPGSGSADIRLWLEVREYFALADASGTTRAVQIRIGGYAVCSEIDQPIAALATTDVEDNTLTEIVAAHQRALDEVSNQLLGQLVDVCKDGQPVT
ncbi:MAG: ABC-type transport auxiliary lipoprotein family protein [Gammaproteobacteria bacterium]|nr:ABC-type transport auxiliary lipoprotein family protein [Gammaproteobacteria bacterium]